tara:strand:- start:1348 stop:1617 length:270 start_codon:yes stop_codon:yes gene_type:complete
MKNLLKVGDRIGNTDFTVKSVVESIINRYKSNGRRVRVKTAFYFIENSKGSHRVLNWKNQKVSDCEMYCTTFGSKWKYKTWSMIKVLEK